MKRILNKTTMAIILALAVLFALVGGLFLVKSGSVADAAAGTATIKITTDKTEYFPGDEMDVTLTVNTTDTGFYYATSLLICMTDENASAMNREDQAYFTTTSGSHNVPDRNAARADGLNYFYQDNSHITSAAESAYATNAYMFGVLLNNGDGKPASDQLEVKLKIKISDSVTPSNDKTYYIGVPKMQIFSVQVQDGPGNQYDHKLDSTGAAIVNASVGFKVKEASDKKGIDLLKLGQGDAKEDLDTTAIDKEEDGTLDYETVLNGMPGTPIELTVTDAASQLAAYIEFEADAGAPYATLVSSLVKTADAKTAASGGVKMADKTVAKFDIPEPYVYSGTDGGEYYGLNGKRIATIIATAENGDVDCYYVDVTVVSAILTDAEVTVSLNSTVPNGATQSTKYGLYYKDTSDGDTIKEVETFDSANEEYIVYIPDNATAISFTVTVSFGHSEKDKVKLSLGGSYSGAFNVGADADINSGTHKAPFNVTFTQGNLSASDNTTLTVTCEAESGETQASKTYKFALTVLSTDTTLKDDKITVKGETHQDREFTNEEDLAGTNGVDFYYYILGEGDNGKALVIVEPNFTGATVETAGGQSYTPGGVTVSEGANQKIRIVSEAGNAKEYSFTLVNKIALQLSSTATIDFVKLRTESGAMRYTQTYKKAGWTHGVEDYKEERIVLGKIPLTYSIGDFLSQIHEDCRSSVNLFSVLDGSTVQLITKGVVNTSVSGLTDAILTDGENYGIGTGWYIQYVKSDNSVIETIYLSVLGDLDGDAHITSNDMTSVNTYASGVDLTIFDDADKLEFLLAALFNATGVVDTITAGAIRTYFQGQTNYDSVYNNTFNNM